MFETSKHVPKTEKRCCVFKDNLLLCNIFLRNLLQLRFCFRFISNSLRAFKSFFGLMIKFSAVISFFLTTLNL